MNNCLCGMGMNAEAMGPRESSGSWPCVKNMHKSVCMCQKKQMIVWWKDSCCSQNKAKFKLLIRDGLFQVLKRGALTTTIENEAHFVCWNVPYTTSLLKSFRSYLRM